VVGGRGPYNVCNAPMPLKLVPHKLASLGTGFGVCDLPCAPENGPVKGERACSLDELRVQVRIDSVLNLSGVTHMLQAQRWANSRFPVGRV
jgi:hypothetical protein